MCPIPLCLYNRIYIYMYLHGMFKPTVVSFCEVKSINYNKSKKYLCDSCKRGI